MASADSLDKRIMDRSKGRPELEAADLPDLAGNIFEPTDEEVEAFRSSLIQEQALREERVQRALERASRPPEAPPLPEIPFDEFGELDLSAVGD